MAAGHWLSRGRWRTGKDAGRRRGPRPRGGILSTAYSEGRLSKDEYDARLESALSGAAIVLGHVARSQIKRTGEQGAGLALAGLILGWAAVILGIVLVAAVLAIASRSAAPAPAGWDLVHIEGVRGSNSLSSTRKFPKLHPKIAGQRLIWAPAQPAAASARFRRQRS